jgi:hypothetical protein
MRRLDRPVSDGDEIRDYETRLRRAGLPLLIEDYSAREDVFTRLLPLLGLLFVLELSNALNFDWSLAANVACVIGALLVLFVPVGLLNRSRGQRALSLPRRVGNLEIGIFLLVPPLLPLIGGLQWQSAMNTLIGNALVLAILFWIVAYGLLSIVRWSLTQLVSQLVGSLTMLARAIPLLLFFALVLFINTEMWQVFGNIPTGDLLGVIALFVTLGSLFLGIRLPREVQELAERENVEPDLSRRQRLNVGLVMFVSYSLQTLVVALAVGLFFVCFGLLTIPDSLIVTWLGDHGDAVGSVVLFGHETVITDQLLRVSTAIASFSGLYYAIAMLTDVTYRGEFLGGFERSMHKTFALRAEYLAARAGSSTRAAADQHAVAR